MDALESLRRERADEVLAPERLELRGERRGLDLDRQDSASVADHPGEVSDRGTDHLLPDLADPTDPVEVAEKTAAVSLEDAAGNVSVAVTQMFIIPPSGTGGSSQEAVDHGARVRVVGSQPVDVDVEALFQLLRLILITITTTTTTTTEYETARRRNVDDENATPMRVIPCLSTTGQMAREGQIWRRC